MNSSKNDGTENLTAEQVPGTPFQIMGKENRWFLVFGKDMIAPEQKSRDAVITYMRENEWFIIGAYAGVLAQQILKQELEAIFKPAQKMSHDEKSIITDFKNS